MQLVFKVRLISALSKASIKRKETLEDITSEDTEEDRAFLLGKKDAEDIDESLTQWAHAPRWPAVSLLSISYRFAIYLHF